MNWLELIAEIAYIIGAGAAVTLALIYWDMYKSIRNDLRALRSTVYALYSDPENSTETSQVLGLIHKELSNIIRSL